MVENRATGCPDLKVHSRIVCDTSHNSLHTSAAEPAVNGVIYIITSHGEDGSRPQGPLYPRNNTENIDYTTSE